MTVEELLDRVNRQLKAGGLSPEDEVCVRNPDVSEAAMEAGSNGYHEADEVLFPRDGRMIILGES